MRPCRDVRARLHEGVDDHALQGNDTAGIELRCRDRDVLLKYSAWAQHDQVPVGYACGK